MEDTFESLGVFEALLKGLEKQGIHIPTPVQKQGIPVLLTGRDVLAQSETGSGKTLCYLLPIFATVDSKKRQAQAIIITPTHELAAQVYKQGTVLSQNAGLGIDCALVIGGASMTRQLDKLKEKPQVIIGSYGRILDLIQKKKINPQGVQTIVIDEADRMLDSKNKDGVLAILKTTFKERQLALFSASFSDEILEIAKEICKPDVLMLIPEAEPPLPTTINHVFIVADRREKFLVLRKILAGEKNGKAIVFINNPENIEVLVDKLNHHGILAAGIYGGVYKTKRQNAMEDFREGRIRVLLSSDIGARGLDIPGITHVVNLDIPEEPVFYLHRAGRCGRQGQSGCAISIVTDYECKWIHKYEKTWGISFAEKEMSFGLLADASAKQPKLAEKEKPIKTVKKTVAHSSKVPQNAKKQLSPKEKFKAKAILRVKKQREQEQAEAGLGFFAKKALRQAEKEKNSKK